MGLIPRGATCYFSLPVLDLAKIEAGKLELQPTPVHLPTFLSQIFDIIHARAEAKNLVLTL